MGDGRWEMGDGGSVRVEGLRVIRTTSTNKRGGLASAPEKVTIALHHSKYTVRISPSNLKYNLLVLYLGAAGCVRLVPVQYHTILAPRPPRCALVSGRRWSSWVFGEL